MSHFLTITQFHVILSQHFCPFATETTTPLCNRDNHTIWEMAKNITNTHIIRNEIFQRLLWALLIGISLANVQ